MQKNNHDQSKPLTFLLLILIFQDTDIHTSALRYLQLRTENTIDFELLWQGSVLGMLLKVHLLCDTHERDAPKHICIAKMIAQS